MVERKEERGRLGAMGAAGVLLLAVSAPAPADSLSGGQQFLCAAVEAVLCTADGTCAEGPPWDLDIPSFVNVDLKRKVLATTEASGENRSTPVARIERADGLIVLQGQERGRAFSLLLDEETGRATLSTVTDGLVVNVFGACTPAGG